MPKDATPNEIILRDENFTNENHEEIAEMLNTEWSAETSLTELSEVYGFKPTAVQTVYRRHFGVPESLFNDGIQDMRTIEEIKSMHSESTYKDYRESRKNGELDVRSTRNVEYIEGEEPKEWKVDGNRTDKISEITESVEMKMYQKGYREGFQDGMKQSKDGSETL